MDIQSQLFNGYGDGQGFDAVNYAAGCCSCSCSCSCSCCCSASTTVDSQS